MSSYDLVLILLGTNDLVNLGQPPETTVDALLARRVPSDHLLQLHVDLEPADFRDDGVNLNGTGHEKFTIAADRQLSGRWTRRSLPAGCTRITDDSRS